MPCVHMPHHVSVSPGILASEVPTPGILGPRYHSHQGPMDAILDAGHQPWWRHLMAQVVAGVSSQAEIAIHQGHKGQGLSPGAEAQQLWAGGT